VNHLALDTATEVLSVALRVTDAGRNHVLTASRDQGLKHTGRLMILVERLLSDAGLQPRDLDLVSCMRGPGSFTGLRIGMSTAKGLGWAIAEARGLDAPPVVSVPTLEAMAAQVAASPASVTIPLIDGRKQRFYSAVFRNSRRITADLDLEPHELYRTISTTVYEAGLDSVSWVLTGPHASTFLARLEELDSEVNRAGMAVDPGCRDGWARGLLELAERQFASSGPDKLDAGPEYLRLSEAEETLRAGRDSL
jgi:tRNA threonylcarbamoyladenosine biosynthesis protein TsaB